MIIFILVLRLCITLAMYTIIHFIKREKQGHDVLYITMVVEYNILCDASISLDTRN